MNYRNFNFNDGINAPCYKCSDRRDGCHSACEKFKTFKMAIEENKKKKVYCNFEPWSRTSIIETKGIGKRK